MTPEGIPTADFDFSFTQDSFGVTRPAFGGFNAMYAAATRCIRTPDDLARLILEVADTGIGMPDSALETLFHPYTQVPKATAEQVNGTGLGLAICRHYCHMMGGEIAVVSESGKGSTFTVSLPVHVADVAAVPEPEMEITAGQAVLFKTEDKTKETLVG